MTAAEWSGEGGGGEGGGGFEVGVRVGEQEGVV